MKLERVIRLKMLGDDISWMQTKLKEFGFYNDIIQGYYDQNTLVAVTKFQRFVNIKPDGVVGSQTWNHIINISTKRNKDKKKYTDDTITNNVSFVGNNGLIIYDRVNSTEFYTEERRKNTILISNSGTSYRPELAIKSWTHFLKKDKKGNPIKENGVFTKIKRSSNYVIGGSSLESNIWDGKIVKCFDDNNWSYHIELLNGDISKEINSNAITIEICNYGYLIKGHDDKFYNKTNNIVDNSEVVELDEEFMGHKYWHKYTDAQIESLRKLIIHLQIKHGIKINRGTYDDKGFVPYYDKDWFAYDPKWLETGGIKVGYQLSINAMGVFPQKEIMSMLNTI